MRVIVHHCDCRQLESVSECVCVSVCRTCFGASQSARVWQAITIISQWKDKQAKQLKTVPIYLYSIRFSFSFSSSSAPLNIVSAWRDNKSTSSANCSGYNRFDILYLKLNSSVYFDYIEWGIASSQLPSSTSLFKILFVALSFCCLQSFSQVNCGRRRLQLLN